MSVHVNCSFHGDIVDAASVCGHAANSFEKRVPAPFFWTDENAEDPCGWCENCHVRYEAAGQEWVGEVEDKLDAKLMCVHCFSDIIKFNGYK